MKPCNSALQSSKKALQEQYNRDRIGGGARRGKGRKGKKRRVSFFIKPKQLSFCIFNILKREKEDSGDKNKDLKTTMYSS